MCFDDVMQIVVILIASTLEALMMNTQIYKSPFLSEITFVQHLHDTQFALLCNREDHKQKNNIAHAYILLL